LEVATARKGQKIDLNVKAQGPPNNKREASGAYLQGTRDLRAKSQKKLNHLLSCAYYSCAAAIITVSFQFYQMSPKREGYNYAQVYKLVFASLGGRGGTNATAPPGDGCKRGSASSGLKRVRGLDYKAQVWLSGAFQDISPAICSQIEKIAYNTKKKK